MSGVQKLRFILARSTLAAGFLWLNLGTNGCSMLKEKEEPDPAMAALRPTEPLPPEKAQELANNVASNWFYGEGIGSTAITAGTCVLFPPFIAVVVGNAALSLSGYEPLTISGALPEEQGQTWSETYDSIASGPGRLTSAVAGKEFKTKERIKEDYKKFMVDASSEKSNENDPKDPNEGVN